MDLSVSTPTPAFLNDILDEVRVFYGREVRLVSDAPVRLSHEESLAGGIRRVRAALSFASGGEYAFEASAPEGTGALEDKRVHKRLIKTCVYRVFRQASGVRPPWGSLTGIRPTRLIWAAMAEGKTLEQAEKDLHDVFDVTEEKCRLTAETVRVQQSLPLQGKDQIDLYVGIPFCVSRCAYCSFLSGELGKGELKAPYVDALLKEIAAARELIAARGFEIRAFYMGGGTPTALDARSLDRVLTALDPLTARCVEVTVEAGRPDTLDAEKFDVLKAHRAARISINPQTMHDETLRRIGRRHTRADTEKAYAMAREKGFSHINMDLIAGLPGETPEMFGETLHWSRDLRPESLTVHTLCIKHSSLFNLWQAQLPDGEMTARMVRAGREEAAQRGMRPYYLYRQKYMAGNLENVGYALPGHEGLYNIGMMEENADVLALGAGGISKRVNTASGKIKRAPNVSDIREYIDRVEEMARRKEDLFAPDPEF